MLKKLFNFVVDKYNFVVDKYKKSQMTLVDIEDQETKLDVLNLLTLAVVVDNKIDETEIIEIAKTIKEILFVHKNIDDIKTMIINILNNFDSSTSSNIYIHHFKAQCTLLSEKLNNKQKDELLSILIEFLQADGVVEEEEKILLKLYRENIQYNGIFGKSTKIEDECPGCRGGNVLLYKSEEIDRWIKPKKVTETLASGKSKTRYIKTTYIQEKLYYQCQDCMEKFTTTRTREK